MNFLLTVVNFHGEKPQCMCGIIHKCQEDEARLQKLSSHTKQKRQCSVIAV